MKIIAKFTTSDGKVTTATSIGQPARWSATMAARAPTSARATSSRSQATRASPLPGQHSGPAHGRVHGAVHLVDRHDGNDDDRFCWLNG